MIVFFAVITVAFGTLFAAIGYGMLFALAMSQKQNIAVIWFILLAFSSLPFVSADISWYYSLPFWIIPIFYAIFKFPVSKYKKISIIFLTIGVSLLVSFFYWFYSILKYAGI